MGRVRRGVLDGTCYRFASWDMMYNGDIVADVGGWVLRVESGLPAGGQRDMVVIAVSPDGDEYRTDRLEDRATLLFTLPGIERYWADDT